MSRRNAFAALVQSDSDSEPESTTVQETTISKVQPMHKPMHKPMPISNAPAPAASAASSAASASRKQKKTQWKPLNLAALPDRAWHKPGGRQVGAASKQSARYRRTQDGRLVLVAPGAPPAKDPETAGQFPALNGNTTSSAPVMGSWAQGIEAVIAAKDLEDPAIERKRQQAARAAWLAKQRVANRATVYDDDYYGDEEEEQEIDLADYKTMHVPVSSTTFTDKEYMDLMEYEYETQWQPPAGAISGLGSTLNGSGWWSDEE